MAEYYWHVHHDVLFEVLIEPIANRIDYIKKNKPKKEIKLRLRLLHKVKDTENALSEWKEYKNKKAPLLKEHKNKKALLWKEYKNKKAPLLKEYEDKKAQLLKEHKNKKALLWKEYKNKEAPLWKEYEDKKAQLLKLLKTHKKECPNCLWNGTSI